MLMDMKEIFFYHFIPIACIERKKKHSIFSFKSCQFHQFAVGCIIIDMHGLIKEFYSGTEIDLCLTDKTIDQYPIAPELLQDAPLEEKTKANRVFE